MKFSKSLGNLRDLEGGLKRIGKSLSSCNFSAHREDENQVRLVNKDGSYHVDHVHPPNGLSKYFRNTFSFLLEIKWRWVIIGSAVCFPLSWVIFAFIYYLVAYTNGDFATPGKTDTNVTAPMATSENLSATTVCVTNVRNFVDMFLFSVESQQTVGYGYRYPSEACPLLISLLCFQYVFGAILQGCICGIVWARLVRPKRRGQEVVFSRHAVIARDDRQRLCFMFRISDIAGNHLVQLSIRMYMAVKSVGKEGDGLFRLVHMNLGQQDGRDRMLLLWPALVSHVIDHDSPLYTYSMADLEKGDFEIIAVVEGIVEATGLTAQTRTSYLPKEVLWGHRFQPMNTICKRKNEVRIQYQQFDKTYAVETSTASAKTLEENASQTDEAPGTPHMGRTMRRNFSYFS